MNLYLIIKKTTSSSHIPATTSLTQGWYLNKILFNQQLHKQYHSLTNLTPTISSTSGSSTSNNEIIGEICYYIHNARVRGENK